MISAIMLYSMQIACLVGLAGLALEHVAAWRRLPRRALWAGALAFSAALPAIAVLTPQQAIAPPAFVMTHSAPLSVAPPNTAAEEFRASAAAAPGETRSPPRQHQLTWPTRQ